MASVTSDAQVANTEPQVPLSVNKEASDGETGQKESPVNDSEFETKAPRTPAIAYFLGAIASIGGFMFGYESGEISGFLKMTDFIDRFGQHNAATDSVTFSSVRQGTIVGLFSIGTLIGCLGSAPMADGIGRRYTISFAAFFYIIGVIIEITSSTVWVQFAMGRFVAGLGIGALSTCVPMYQSESIPRAIRGPMVASYQLLIVTGIWTAYMVNYGTEDAYHNSAQWRIPNGIAALWALLLGSFILLMPESPRYAYRIGREEEARLTMARLNGVAPDSALINEEIAEIEEKLVIERATAVGEQHWYDIFTGPRMLYRTLLGMVMQAGQQLTGANFFFYYGTTIFAATGISNSYITSIILGTVNVVSTVASLWLVEKFGRRPMLMVGAAWMFMCFLVFSFVGHFQLDSLDPSSTPQAGSIMIVFACLFIVAFAITWGPLAWAVVGEMYPSQYRAKCMGLAIATNWLFNFIISFCTPFITAKIDYLYGLVFAVCCFALVIIVYFFVIETKDRSLEEVDTMYILHVNPIGSRNWQNNRGEKEGNDDGIFEREKVNEVGEAGTPKTTV